MMSLNYYFFLLTDFIDRKIIPGFKIKKQDLVIDIGSGDKPFWRGDVFLDNLNLDNKQRITGKDIIHNLGTFVNGDITKTKFKNKTFDFSFCSHLLEHVEHPDLAIKEIV
ncbi:MAG TPA: methyltransferase domain-containing protein, partial [Verrucomicrobiae bacterium]|nr:methyltransferase domain-containing protein [Verrucomicrobiae bacterium]